MTEGNEDAMRIEVLKKINAAGHNANVPGATGSMLMTLGLDITDVEDAITWLSSKDYIYVNQRRFLITPKGAAYLSAHGS